ncbi:MAG: hypothetical protein Q9188_007584 [Gyalolechia gomerana]
MPPKSSFGGVGQIPVIDISPLPTTSTSTIWDPTTIARDFASDHVSRQANNVNDRYRNVDPAAANRSDRNLALSAASEVNDRPSRLFHGLYQGQQQFIPTAIDQSYFGSDWSGFPHSIRTPPDPSPSTPFSQSALRDGSGGSFNGSPTESATTLTYPPSLTPRTHNIHQREAATGSEANLGRSTGATTSTRGLDENLSPNPGRGSSVRKKQRKEVRERAMTPSRSSQRGEDGRKGTPLTHKQDGSLSSTQSNQSHASFDFSKVDRSGESSHAPGILRLGQRSSSLHGQRSLPDEKGFSIQIGSELFKLSGASIMSDGRF